MIDRQRFWRVPLDAARIPRACGTVFVIDDRCKGCGFCVEYCPRHVLALSKTFNRKGYHPPRIAREGECVNCNLCEMICPDFAIFSCAIRRADTPVCVEQAEQTRVSALHEEATA